LSFLDIASCEVPTEHMHYIREMWACAVHFIMENMRSQTVILANSPQSSDHAYLTALSTHYLHLWCNG
jgi:hypothetical protein